MECADEGFDGLARSVEINQHGVERVRSGDRQCLLHGGSLSGQRNFGGMLEKADKGIPHGRMVFEDENLDRRCKSSH